MGNMWDPWKSHDSNMTGVSSSPSTAMRVVRFVLKLMIVSTSWLWTWWWGEDVVEALMFSAVECPVYIVS